MAQKKPNILFLLTDDQRYGTISALGNPQMITPNMDALVADGVSFMNAHIPSGTVGAVCMPSRAMIHTGKTLYHLLENGQRIAPEDVLLGETLKCQGYQTYGIGKWHNSPAAFNRSFDDGDRIFFGGMEDHWNVPCNHFDPTGEYACRYPKLMNPRASNTPTTVISDHTLHGQHSTDIFSETAMNYINNYDKEDPFFLYLAYMAPHDPRTMPKEFMDMYDVDSIELPENYRELHEFEYGVYNCRDEKLISYPRTEDEVKRHLAEYYAMISHLDARIGEIIGALKAKGLYEDTIIILAGDNGLALGQHGLAGKQNCYEHSIKIPLVMAGPNIPKNQISHDFVYLLDIYPTLCDCLGIEIPATVEGQSFYKSLQGQEDGREYIYAGFAHLVRSIKTKDYKLIEYQLEGKRRQQLFHLPSDPLELHDLIDQEPDIAKALYVKMKEAADLWDDAKHPTGDTFWNGIAKPINPPALTRLSV